MQSKEGDIMEECFNMDDVTRLLNESKSMHDDFVTSIRYDRTSIILEYGKIGEWEDHYYGRYHKVTITYKLDDSDNGYGLTVCRVTPRGTRYVPFELDDLNSWNTLMYKYAVDSFGEITLFMNAWKGKQALSVELFFTPVSVTYHWE